MQIIELPGFKEIHVNEDDRTFGVMNIIRVKHIKGEKIIYICILDEFESLEDS
jgi:hypothetical protein